MISRLGPYELNTIVTGDARELAKGIPDESVDLIFTDPPYSLEFLPLYGWLAETAARVLRSDGLCLSLCGHFGLPDVMRMMEKHLEYVWIGGMIHNISNAPIFPLKMWAAWKPLVWYKRKGTIDKQWTFDLFQPTMNDKRFHKWGQPESHAGYYIERLSELGQIIFDPFTGGGTVPAVCKMLGRNYLAFEIDPDVAERARERVYNTQPPLLVLQPEQSVMQL